MKALRDASSIASHLHVLSKDTKMTLINRRHQRVVGQGFFHTAKLEAEDGRKLRYVYDCGAMKKY